MAINFGLEYELEGIREAIDVPAEWTITHEASLREGGLEFLFRKKLSLDSTKDAISNLLESINSSFTVSHRCSTHIHIDTQSLDGAQRLAMMMGLILHDDWFFNYGKGRDRNNFCTPVLYSPNNALVCFNKTRRATDWKDGVPVRRNEVRPAALTFVDNKYLSVNPNRMNDLGTIELRHFAPLINIQDSNVVLDKIAEIHALASDVAPTAWDDAATPFNNIDSVSPDAYEWVLSAYSAYKQMTGER